MEPLKTVSPAAAAALLGAGYLLGSVPFALLLGKAKGVDIRTIGSGNVGATNLTRALGLRWGILAFVLDFLKGFLPPAAVLWMLPPSPGSPLPAHLAAMAAGLSAILGHVFPVYLRFRGGKGVATSFGAIAALSPLAALAAGIVWLGVFLIWRTVSIASIAAAITFPTATAVLFLGAPLEVAIPMDALAALLAVMIVARHRSNIRRLLSGGEKRF